MTNILQELVDAIQHQTGIETQLIYGLGAINENIAMPTNVIYLSIDSISLKTMNPDDGYVIHYNIHYHMAMTAGPFLSSLFRLGLFGISATAAIQPYQVNDRIIYYFATVSAVAYAWDDESSIRSQPIRHIAILGKDVELEGEEHEKNHTTIIHHDRGR